jgi:hypothetical protein
MFSLGCHAIYSMNLANFPYINLLSFPFLASCGTFYIVDSFGKLGLQAQICQYHEQSLCC